MNSNNTPIALLVIYDKGFKFKYKKYYLQTGVNLIGSHPLSNINIIPGDGQRIAQKAAKLIITQDLASIQPIEKGSIYVLSNMKKKNNLMVEIQPGTKYIIQMEKDFIICGRKALMQISTLEQLLQIKDVVNAANFNINKKVNNSLPVRSNQSKKQQIKNQRYVPSSQFQATIPLDNTYNFEATIPLDNNYEQFQATQLIDQQVEGVYDATLPIDADIQFVAQNYNQKQERPNYQIKPSIKQSQQFRSSLQNRIYPSLQKAVQNKKNQQMINENSMNKNTSQAQFSMPQTIKQDEMPATIKQDQPIMPSQANRNSSIFPPTIQENQDDFKLSQIKKKTTVLTKSEPAYRQMRNQKLLQKNVASFEQKRNNNLVDSFQDLFGGINNLTNSNKTVSLKSNSSVQNKNNQNKKLIKQTHSQHGSEHTQKLQSQNQHQKQKIQKSIKRTNLKKIDQVQNDQSQRANLKKCFVIGKISKNDQQKLRKIGYEIQNDDQAQKMNIQLLVIEGDLKLSKVLLLALIKGIQIKPISWVNNQKNKLAGKLQGFLWQHIQKRKGKGKSIFSSNKNFYLQQSLQQQYQKVMTQAGATIIDQLTRTKSKLSIHIIVDQKSKQGKQLYEQKKNYKNWSFYGRKMIIESILMGEQIIDKYKLDSYSF